MVEIIVVIALCRGLGRRLRDKGYKPFWFQAMLVVGWIGGEIMGGFIGGIYHVIRNGPNVEPGLEIYLFAIGVAVMSACFCYLVAHLLPDKNAVAQPAVHTTAEDPFDERIRDANNPYAP